MGLDFKGRVAIVTGAGGGLGKQHALLLASRGAKVVVNDLGADVHGDGGSVSAAQAVVDEIRAAGGEAIVNGASVTDFEAVQKMVQQAVDTWGRVDILVNNAGILRDKSFAKMALAGLMQTLSIEGMKHDIRVNCLAPTAATRMTEGLMPQAVLDALQPQAVSPAMLVMASEDAPNRTILCAGAGSFEVAHITLTQGVHLGTGDDVPERLLQALTQVRERTGESVPMAGSEQGALEVGKAMKAHGH